MKVAQTLFGTHQLLLLEMIKKTTKPILELGAGDNSTRQIHNGCNNYITTIESNANWLNRYQDLKSDRHSLLLLNEVELLEYFAKDTTDWGLVFVDSSTWTGRVAAIQRYKDSADYVIIHDVDWSANNNVFGQVLNGKRDFSDTFKQWVEFSFLPYPSPTTLLGSNKKDLKGIDDVKKMRKINQNI